MVEHWFRQVQTREYCAMFHAIAVENDAMTPEQYWYWLTRIWTEVERPLTFAGAEYWADVWNRCNGDSRTIDEQDREELDALPEHLRVYRGFAVGVAERASIRLKGDDLIAGYSPQFCLGLSWTTELKDAEWFARRYAIQGRMPGVAVKEIKKEDILFYTNGRKEHEAVIDPYKSPINKGTMDCPSRYVAGQSPVLGYVLKWLTAKEIAKE